MDPATAIGVASAAISFLDLTIKLCKLAGQVSTSANGATKQNTELENELKAFKKRIEDINSTQLGQSLKDAADESIAASTELLALLERIRTARSDSKFGTFKAVYLIVKHRDDAAALQHRVQRCQASLVQALTQKTLKTSILHYDFSTVSFGSLDKQATQILAALRTGENRQLELLVQSGELKQQLNDNTGRLVSSIDGLTQKILDMTKPDLKKAFIDSLYFPEFREREGNVSEPCTSTFEWFFDRGGGPSPLPSWGADNLSWHSFPQWLENADSCQQYWLSGKAGSGKSTLMAQVIRNPTRTKDHLRHWSGSRHLCTLSFFLFRAGSQLQVSLKYLLRSLLYQLIVDLPALQEVLMTRFLPTGSDCRIPAWPTSTLKKMLSFAIDIADDCSFFILIDGIDEFQSHEQLREDYSTAAELVEYLFEIQKPPHVKLCVSSRPELRIVERYPSFLETQLAMLNRGDIQTFVHKQLSSLPGLCFSDRVSQEICHRADGMFMWAVFALREMTDGYAFKETLPKLLERLDGMGPSLTTAISHMLRNIEARHRARVAFYLQALGSWNTARQNALESNYPMSVALMAASRSACEVEPTLDFVARCQEEEQDLRNFARGLIEVRIPPWEHKRLCLLKPLRNHSDSSDKKQETPVNWLETSLEAFVHDGSHLFRLSDYCKSSVTLVHRSAYDFFFSEADEEHRTASRALMICNDAAEVPTKVQTGLYSLLWIEPFLVNSRSHRGLRREEVLQRLEWRLADLIRYTACASFSQQQRLAFLDKLLSDIRLELGRSRTTKFAREQREHVPGDIFSGWTTEGRLQLLGEEESYSLGNLPDGYLEVTVRCESQFWLSCGVYTCLEVYYRDAMHGLQQSVLGRLILAKMLPKMLWRLREQVISLEKKGTALIDETWNPDARADKHSRPLTIALAAIQCWTNSSLQRHRLGNLPALIGRWLSGPNASDAPPRSRKAQLSEVQLLRRTAYFQWHPLWSATDGDCSEIEIAKALLSGLWLRLHVFPLEILRAASRVLEPWDAWIAVALEGEPYAPQADEEGAKTKIFRSVNVSFAWLIEERTLPPRCLPDFHITHRLVRFSRSKDGAATILFCHNLNTSLEVWSELANLRRFMDREQTLNEAEIDAIVEDVLCSTALSDDQKKEMVEDIRNWPRGLIASTSRRLLA